MHNDAILAISLSRPPGNLLPNLINAQIIIKSSPQLFLPVQLMILHPRVIKLSIKAQGPHPHGSENAASVVAWNNILCSIAIRCPSIAEFGILWKKFSPALDKALPRFINSLPMLQTFYTSLPLLTSDVIRALSRCPRLYHVHYYKAPPPFAGGSIDSDDVYTLLPTIDDEGFTCLQSFTVTSNFSTALKLLEQTSFPAHRLLSLVVGTIKTESDTDMSNLMQTVAKSFPQIQQLHILLSRCNPADPITLISFDSLRPVLTCSSMRNFVINIWSPLSLDNAAAEEIASSWPHLQRLELNASPLPVSNPNHQLDLSAIFLFSERCPELTYLGLYVQIGDYSVSPPTVSSPKQFACLRSLSLGISNSEWEPLKLAKFLIENTPSQCTIFAALCPELMVFAFYLDNGRYRDTK